MPDSAAVDAALIAKLLADAPLMALATDGVYVDEAAQGATKFIIVSLVDEHDEPQEGSRAYEDALYLVKFVELNTSSTNAKTAAARIDTLLENGTLAPAGYSLMAMFRESRLVPMVEVDDLDPSIRWQHRGGHYRVVVSG
jgi:hypothetical protein